MINPYTYVLVKDTLDDHFNIFISLDNSYYYNPGYWASSVNEAITAFNPFKPEPIGLVSGRLMEHIQILQTFTQSTNPEFFI